MARKRKPKRRMVCSFTYGFHDGSVIACGPETKPSERKIKEEGIYICPDGVMREHYYSPSTWPVGTSDKERRNISLTLANRINTRRAIRELVLPELEAIQKSLEILHQKVNELREGFENRHKNANIPNKPT